MRSKPTSPRWIVRLVVAVAALAALYLVLAYFLRPVAYVAPASKGKAVKIVPGSVEVKAEFVQELKSEIGGRVAMSALDTGKKVREGDLLLQLDTGDIDLEIDRIKNEIEAAEKKVEMGSTLRTDVLNMRDTVAESESKFKSGALAATEMEKQKRLLQQLEQRMELDEVNNKLALENLKNSLQVKERERSKMTITAPMDGVITDVLVRKGGLIGGNSPIATIMTSTRTVEGKFSEEDFASVKVGLPATVRFLTYGQDQYNAKVTKLLPSADPQTQRYTVYLDVFLPEGKTLVPGLTGEVSIIIAERDNAVIIPRRALIGDYVLVVEGSKVAQRKIERGYESLNQVEVRKGLKLGELVIVEQQDRFREGDRVRTETESN